MTDTAIQPLENEKSLELVRKDFLALPKEKVRQIGADPSTIVTKLQGLWPRIFAMRSQLARLYDFNGGHFDRFPDYLRALAYVDALYNLRLKPPDDFPDRVDEAINLRGAMMADIDSLEKHNVIHVDISRMPELTKGYDNIISTLGYLTVFFSENWTKVNGRCGLTKEDLANGDRLVGMIRGVVGARALVENEELADLRDRGFTVVIDTYNEIRDYVGYVCRDEGNADDIAPSAFAGQNKVRHAKKDPAEPDAPAAQKAAAVEPAKSVEPHLSMDKPVPGGPGGSPFLD